VREVALGEPGGDPEAPEAVRELEAPERGPYVGLESALAEPQTEGTETQAETQAGTESEPQAPEGVSRGPAPPRLPLRQAPWCGPQWPSPRTRMTSTPCPLSWMWPLGSWPPKGMDLGDA